MGNHPCGRYVRIFSGFVLLAGVFLPAACSPKAPAAHYAARGIVVSIERGTDGLDRVTILHEAIPDFKNSEGQVTGMEPMAMTFTAAPGLSTANVAPQAKVAFHFEVHWKPVPQLRLIELTPLAAETPLDLGGYSVEMAE